MNTQPKTYTATAVDTRMVTTFQTPDGREFSLSTSLPKGTVITVYASALTSNGGLIDYDGFEVIARPKRNMSQQVSAAADYCELDYEPYHTFEEVAV